MSQWGKCTQLHAVSPRAAQFCSSTCSLNTLCQWTLTVNNRAMEFQSLVSGLPSGEQLLNKWARTERWRKELCYHINSGFKLYSFTFFFSWHDGSHPGPCTDTYSRQVLCSQATSGPGFFESWVLLYNSGKPRTHNLAIPTSWQLGLLPQAQLLLLNPQL